MTSTRMIEVKDPKVAKALEWMMVEMERHEHGEITVSLKKQDGRVTSIEKMVKQRER